MSECVYVLQCLHLQILSGSTSIREIELIGGERKQSIKMHITLAKDNSSPSCLPQVHVHLCFFFVYDKHTKVLYV